MENSKPELNVTFHFLSINKMQSYTLKKELKDVTLNEVEQNINYTGIVPLTADNFNDIIDFYIKQQLVIDQCDLCLTITESSSKKYTVPDIVKQMLKHLHCPLSVLIV